MGLCKSYDLGIYTTYVGTTYATSTVYLYILGLCIIHRLYRTVQ